MQKNKFHHWQAFWHDFDTSPLISLTVHFHRLGRVWHKPGYCHEDYFLIVKSSVPGSVEGRSAELQFFFSWGIFIYGFLLHVSKRITYPNNHVRKNHVERRGIHFRYIFHFIWIFWDAWSMMLHIPSKKKPTPNGGICSMLKGFIPVKSQIAHLKHRYIVIYFLPELWSRKINLYLDFVSPFISFFDPLTIACRWLHMAWIIFYKIC